jgi:hypothetical protein
LKPLPAQEASDGSDAAAAPPADADSPGAAPAGPSDDKDAVALPPVPESISLGSSILSDVLFDALEISEETKKAIREMGFARMTEVQSKTIPPLLQVRLLTELFKRCINCLLLVRVEMCSALLALVAARHCRSLFRPWSCFAKRTSWHETVSLFRFSHSNSCTYHLGIEHQAPALSLLRRRVSWRCKSTPSFAK